ncbi:MAG: hypothetical protein AMJ91_07945, partial [candidate division Zixibacteria bacterium SM23_73_3]
DIRNEYEHFITKFYLVVVHELIMATELCLRVSKELLFESVNVIFHTVTKESLKELLESVFKGVTLLLRNNRQGSRSTNVVLSTLLKRYGRIIKH